MIKLTPAELTAKRLQMQAQKAEAISQLAGNAHYTSPDILVVEQTGDLARSIKVKKDSKGSPLEAVADIVTVKTAEQVRKIGDGIVNVVKKAQKKLSRTIENTEERIENRDMIDGEIAALEIQKARIKKQHAANRKFTAVDNVRIEAENNVFAVKQEKTLAQQHACGEEYFKTLQDLRDIQSQRELLQAQLQKLNEAEIDKKDLLHYANQGLGLSNKG